MDIQNAYELLQLYEKGKVTTKTISEALNISERQAYRVIKIYKEKGILGLQHKGKKQDIKPQNK